MKKIMILLALTLILLSGCIEGDSRQHPEFICKNYETINHEGFCYVKLSEGKYVRCEQIDECTRLDLECKTYKERTYWDGTCYVELNNGRYIECEEVYIYQKEKCGFY